MMGPKSSIASTDRASGVDGRPVVSLPPALTEAFEQATVVSFDLFDTLILRKVAEPRDVFVRMEEALVEEFGGELRGFANARFASEVEVANATWARDRGVEFDLSEVYDRLEVNHPWILLRVSKSELIERELGIERQLCCQHGVGRQLFDHALTLGRRVIVVSDTYLPAHHLQELLRAEGFEGYERLFVSNVEGTNKASGRIFERVQTALGVAPDAILHVGDSEWSDVKQAKSAGFHSLLLPAGRDLITQTNAYSENRMDRVLSAAQGDTSVLLGLQQNNLAHQTLPTMPDDGTSSDEEAEISKTAFNIGYQYLGPITTAFAQWCAAHARRRGIERLCFVAREGWFLQKMYKILAPSLATSDIQDLYFYASRRCLEMAVGSDKSPAEHAAYVLGHQGQLGWFLDSVELSLSETEISKFGFSSLEEHVTRSQVIPLFEAYADHIEALQKQERADYMTYLEQVGVSTARSIALVDSGWSGGSQRRLTKLARAVGSDVELLGLYMVSSHRAKENFVEGSSGMGFIYHLLDIEASGDSRPFLSLVQILEVLLAAPKASLRRMKVDASTGRAEPIFSDDPSKATLHPLTKLIHAGAEAFAHDVLSVPGRPVVLSYDSARSLIERLVMDPSPAEARCVGRLPYDATSFNRLGSRSLLPDPADGWGLLSGPRSALSDFGRSKWRQGYLASRDSTFLPALYLAASPSLWEKNKLPARFWRRARTMAGTLKKGGFWPER